jgi:hypothetical protein
MVLCGALRNAATLLRVCAGSSLRQLTFGPVLTQFDAGAEENAAKATGRSMTTAAITLLALLLIKHFVCDFVLQTPWQIAQKGIYGARGGIVHSGIHVAGTLVILIAVMAPVSTIIVVLIAEFLVHYHIDWGKEQTVRRLHWKAGARFWNAIGFDQLLHGLTYLAIVVYVVGRVAG